MDSRPATHVLTSVADVSPLIPRLSRLSVHRYQDCGVLSYGWQEADEPHASPLVRFE